MPRPIFVRLPVPLIAPPSVRLLPLVSTAPPWLASTIGVAITRLLTPATIVPPLIVALLTAQPRAPLLVAKKVPPLPSIPLALLPPLPHMPGEETLVVVEKKPSDVSSPEEALIE